MEQIIQARHDRGYAPDKGSFSPRRPDRTTIPLLTPVGESVVAKIYPSASGEISYANMLELWRSSFGERRQPPGLPRPLDYLPNSIAASIRKAGDSPAGGRSEERGEGI